jgi:hypothetical protein
MQRKHKIALGLAALAWLAALWGLGARTRPSLEPAAIAAASTRPEQQRPHAKPRVAPDPGSAPGALVNADGSPRLPELQLADLVREVEVDKQRVCPGEDFLVKVQGKPENAAGALPIAELNFNVAGKYGDAIALHAKAPGTRDFTVVASNGVDKIEYRPFQMTILEPNAPECMERAYATLELTRSAADPNVIEARVVATPGLAEPVAFVWDFGDGARTETSAPEATHSYALRDQARSLSSYLVHVTAVDAAGRSAEGRDSIHLMNNHFRARALGDRLMPVVYSPFPKPAKGGWGFDVTFRSIEPDAVAFERAVLTEHSCYAGREDRVHEVPLDVLGVPSRLAPKSVQPASLVLPAAAIAEDTCVAVLELTGDSVPRRVGQAMPGSPIPYRQVSTRFTFEIQAAPPVDRGGAPELAGREVTDPALLANLLQASDRLGSDRVTSVELERIEREGSAELPGATAEP